ncbi:putative carnitine deficiency-associated family protein [Theileria parva strain Muguga]|uniref:Uncharacterized protein n=1 Tax=Theileria parva TaxID=5875 RepID=Q4MZG8_THEPA|nr:putative carnitine deficiency-associated family protein [Theileria parva strain Muguga]EAN31296.1 putative carnitine deficiency-associated family protein [Theileria parva strain Muguga]|eukprot:XP_763579.1 hypothetical protein [Theileria parva strain Muguga]
MDKSILDKKLKTLGYDPPEDYATSFGELVLKLEEEQIKHYTGNKLEKFKSSKGSDWNKLLKNYSEDLKLNLPAEFYDKNQFSDEKKLFLLNKLLNLSISSLYNHTSSDLEDKSSNSSTNQSFLRESDKLVINQLNLFLEELDLPLLNSDSKSSEVKSALELYLKLNHKHAGENTHNQIQDGKLLNNFLNDYSQGLKDNNDFIHLLRSLYTDDLCKLQSETIWITKEFSKLLKP